MKKSLLLYFLLAISLTGFTQQIEQLDSMAFDMDEIVVTATRTERNFSSLPNPTIIIKREDIINSGNYNLNDVLQEVPGLTTTNGFGTGEGVQIQGLDANYVKILINGQPLIGRSAGTFDLNRIFLQQVKKIEIVKGASSALYGNEALGGVINIITDQNFTQHNFDLSAKYETNQSADLYLGYGKQLNNQEFGINARAFSTDGYELNSNSVTAVYTDPYANAEANAFWNKAWSDKLESKLLTRYFYQDADDTSFGNNDPQKTKEWMVNALIDYAIDDKWKSTLDIQTTQYDVNSDISGDFYEETLIRPEFRMFYSPNSTTQLISGLGYKKESLNQNLLTENPELNTAYAFAQYDAFYFDNKLNIIAGLRYDNHKEYSSQLSPKLSARYEVNKAFAIRGSAGQGFKRPDFRQLYYNFSNPLGNYLLVGTEVVDTGNTLSPETSWNYNLGLQFQKKKIKTEANLFYNQIKDLIDFYDTGDVANNGLRLFTYQNFDEVITSGIETSASYKLFNNTQLSGGYQYLYSEDVNIKEQFEQGEFARDPITGQTIRIDEDDYLGLYNRSKHMANLKIDQNIPNIKSNANIRLAYRSKFGLFDSNGNVGFDKYDAYVDGYTIVDFAYNYKLKENMTISIGADNIFNYTDPNNIPNLPGTLIHTNLFFKF